MTGSGPADAARLIPSPRLDVRVRNREGTLVVARAGTVFEFEDVAAGVWRSLDGRRTLLDVARAVADTYQVSVEHAAATATGLVARLHDARIVDYRAADSGDAAAGSTAAGAADRPPYVSRFDQWDSRASVRTKPARRLDPEQEGSLYFPPELAPEVSHPFVRDAGPAAARLVLLHRLYDYMRFTSELEATTVIPVATAIARGRGGFPAPAALRADAFKIVTDEAWHAQFSDDLVRQLEAQTMVIPLAYEPAFRRRLDRMLGRVEPSLRPAAALAAAVCSETLISGLLSRLPNDRRLPPAVSATVRDHAEDEGRHHAYFRSVLNRFWPALSPPERRALGPLLPGIVTAFLEPDYAYIRRALVAVGLDPDRAGQVVADSYPRAEVRRSCAEAARWTVRYVAEIGALDDPGTKAEFRAEGLLAAGDGAA
jgi:P-aminobenzoate N-oxygenase AurF/Coenzyme PQQ synthesis protein D (PqqD)